MINKIDLTPVVNTKVKKWKKTYARVTNYGNLHSMMLGEYKNSKISIDELAARMGKSVKTVRKYLSAPEYNTFETISDLVLAMTGKVIFVKAASPYDGDAIEMQNGKHTHEETVTAS